MNSLHGWILTTALGCFAAGMTSGLVLPDILQAGAADEANDRDVTYVRQLTADYGLDAHQQQVLRAICADRRRAELDALRNAAVEDLPPQLQAILREARFRQFERTRMLLNPEQRERFDAATRLQKDR